MDYVLPGRAGGVMARDLRREGESYASAFPANLGGPAPGNYDGEPQKMDTCRLIGTKPRKMGKRGPSPQTGTNPPVHAPNCNRTSRGRPYTDPTPTLNPSN